MSNSREKSKAKASSKVSEEKREASSSNSNAANGTAANAKTDDFFSFLINETLRSAGQAGLDAGYKSASFAIKHMPTEQLLKVGSAATSAIGDAVMSTEL